MHILSFTAALWENIPGCVLPFSFGIGSGRERKKIMHKYCKFSCCFCSFRQLQTIYAKDTKSLDVCEVCLYCCQRLKVFQLVSESILITTVRCLKWEILQNIRQIPTSYKENSKFSSLLLNLDLFLTLSQFDCWAGFAICQVWKTEISHCSFIFS